MKEIIRDGLAELGLLDQVPQEAPEQLAEYGRLMLEKNQMMNLTAIAEKENAAETLLMAKGFSDPVVSITKDKVDVVINAASITDPQRAQIEDIVKRKTETGAENIVITLLNLQE